MARGNLSWRGALCGVAVAVAFAGCAVPKYDVKLAAATSDWKEQIGSFITSTEEKAGSPAGEYAQNTKFYTEVQASIGGKIADLKASSGSGKATEILQLLSKDIENLRQLHESGGAAGLTQAVGEPARSAIET